MENAQLNHVEKRVQLVTESMADMSLPSDSFDAVLANVAIQNIKSRDGRRDAIANIYRVTKPGGQIRVVDIQFIKEYRDDLVALGAIDVKTKWFGMSGWFRQSAVCVEARFGIEARVVTVRDAAAAESLGATGVE